MNFTTEDYVLIGIVVFMLVVGLVLWVVEEWGKTRANRIIKKMEDEANHWKEEHPEHKDGDSI